MKINNTKAIVRAPFSPIGEKVSPAIVLGADEGNPQRNTTLTPTLSQNWERGAQRGSVVITIVLFMVILMTSSAVVLSGVLSKHVRASQDYLSSEKAFAGANSGMEEMRYITLKQANTDPDDVNGEISYDDQIVTYKALAKNDARCIIASGTFRNLVRRVQLGGEGCN